MSENLTRAFICIDFPDEVIKEIARIYEILENRPFTGKFIELENLHLTFKFLGEISDEKIKEISDKLKDVSLHKLEASLGEIGIFFVGKLHKPKIVWIKLNGKSIWDLQEIIDEKLKDIFPKEEKFNSHVTLARINYVKDAKDFEKYAKNTNAKGIKFEVNCFKLKSSELRPNGPVYRDLCVFNLK